MRPARPATTFTSVTASWKQIMLDVLHGFFVIAVIIAVDYGVRRAQVVGPGSEKAMARVVVTVATPAVLFVTLSEADVSQVFSAPVAVTVITSLTIAALTAVVVRLRWRMNRGDAAVTALAASYVNANNLGIPIAAYVLGDTTVIAPVLLFQLGLMLPAALLVLDHASNSHAGSSRVSAAGRALKSAVTSPVTIASVAGLIVGGTRVHVPGIILDPLTMLADMAVPVALLTFGISLVGATLPGRGQDRGQLATLSAAKLLVQPALALGLGRGVFGLTGHGLLIVTVLAALPTAQNVLTAALAYDRTIPLARDTVTLTTVASLPIILVIVVLLR
jgi:malonate transporter and related proteins